MKFGTELFHLKKICIYFSHYQSVRLQAFITLIIEYFINYEYFIAQVYQFL